MKKFLVFWLPVICYAGFIFFISSLPPSRLPTYAAYDKIIHLIEFAVLGLLLSRAIVNYNTKLKPLRLFFLVVFCVLFYGVTDEFHQSFVPGRVVELGDIFADSFGGIVGNLVYQWLR